MIDFHNQYSAIASMAVREFEWKHPFGVVKTKNMDIVGFEEKPINRSHINAGVYVLSPQSLNELIINERTNIMSVAMNFIFYFDSFVVNT